jgi:hypothetical protein
MLALGWRIPFLMDLFLFFSFASAWMSFSSFMDEFISFIRIKETNQRKAALMCWPSAALRASA